MKVEVGESLVYSWLKHIKNCHIVQLNWKSSPTWELNKEAQITQLKEMADRVFTEKYGKGVFKQGSTRQLMKQGETDVLGIAFETAGPRLYAVDVAFHEGGLNYKSKEDTITSVSKKCIRTAMCLMAYFDIPAGDIIFATPKAPMTWRAELLDAMNTVNEIFTEQNLEYRGFFISDEDFKEQILDPMLDISRQVADTSELFLRGIQLYKLFYPLK